MDRFNRIVKDRWTKDGGSGSDLYSTDITFDESGNITRQVDNLHRNYGGASNPGVFDASYSIDSRSRLTRTQEGHWNGSSISTLWRDQQWTLSQTGNWARDKEDLNGDGDFTDTGEVDDTRAHNVANELLTRDTDSNSSVNYTLTHDAVGNMTDDGKDYKFVYDALGRLKTVKNQSNTVVAEYTYNGLNMRIGWHYDADADADVDGSDPWYNFAMDDRWRIVATFRGSDTSPKELFAYHNAGANGRGSSSYIDSVILRNKDANTAWTSASDATLEERLYYAQNWRADVSAVLSDAGLVKEWVKYTSYGIPVRIDPGDYNRDGFVNGTDSDDYGDDFDNTRAEADVDFDGDVDVNDYDLFSAWWDAPSTAGRFTLSASSIGNRVGYAGYQYDPTFVGASRAIYHVRNRVYDAGLGLWTRRDPIGYIEIPSLYHYVGQQPAIANDPYGLWMNIDFVFHYLYGWGLPVDLGTIGNLGAYMAHPAIAKRRTQAIVQARQFSILAGRRLIDKLKCKTCSDLPYEAWTMTSWTVRGSVSRSEFVNPVVIAYMIGFDVQSFLFLDWTYSIGGHHLDRTTTCIIYANACHGCSQPMGGHFSYDCDIDWTMSDLFTDPLDVTEISELIGPILGPPFYLLLNRTLTNTIGDVLASRPLKN